MSRQYDEQKARTAKTEKKSDPGSDFWSFHPTEAQRKALQAMLEADTDPLALLEGEVVRGVSLTVTRARTNDSFTVVARDRFASFGEGQALSTFHVELHKALLAMAYVLTTLHPDWPAKRVTTANRELDW